MQHHPARSRRTSPALLVVLLSVIGVLAMFVPAGAAPAPLAAPEVLVPGAPVTTSEPRFAIQGRAQGGASILVFRDADGDGTLDRGARPVAEGFVLVGGELFEVMVDLGEGVNRFLVRASLDGRVSPVVAVAPITYEVSDPGAAELWPGMLAVKVRDLSTGLAQLDRLQADGVITSIRQTFTNDPGRTREQSALGAWNRVHLPEGTEDAVMRMLSAQPWVEHAERVPVMRPNGAANDPGANGGIGGVKQWGLDKTQARGAWDYSTGGPPVEVAMLDVGFDTSHPDLAGKLVMEHSDQNWCDDPHATATTGVAAAKTNNGIGIAGVGYHTVPVGYELSIVGCSVSPSWADYLKQAADRGFEIANMSFAGGSSAAHAEAVRYASNRGMLLVAGAGNAGSTTKQYPAAYPEVMGVSATTSADKRWSQSSYGDWLSLAAPGDGILVPCAGGIYCVGSGTSLAAPHVAGGAALLRHRWGDPGLRLRGIIEDSADDIGGEAFHNNFGHGRLNLARGMREEAVRLWGSTRYATNQAINRSAKPVAPPTRPSPYVASRAVLGAGDASSETGWVDLLPAAGLNFGGDTGFLLSTRSSLDTNANNELLRLFLKSNDTARQVVIPGGTSTGISSSVESALRARYSVTRVAGADRYATAAQLAEMVTSGRSVDRALLVRGDTPWDALSMSAVAAAYGYPLLYTTTNTLPTATCAYLQNHAAAINYVHVAGGSVAISDAVANQAASCAGAAVVRHAGANREDTSALIAESHFGGAQHFIVASGYTWPDAISGSVLAQAAGAPVLLTGSSALSSYAAGYIAPRVTSLSRGWVLGGEATLARKVETDLESRLGAR